MIVRHVTPRATRHTLLNHAPPGRLVRRAYATEMEQNEARLASKFNEAEAIALGISPQSANGTNTESRKRRRRQAGPPPLDPIVHAFLTSQHMQATTGRLGSTNFGFYQPNSVLSNPPRPSDVTLELLLAAQAHLGHSTSLWNSANSRYIFGIREGIHIISLDVTAAHLRRAARVVSGVAERGGIILFVGNRPGFDRPVVRAAQLAGACHLFERWTPGSITNGQQILGRCRMKVVDEHDTELSGFRDQLYERTVLKPDLVVVLNPLENRVLLQECAQSGIPTIGVIDTDANPTWVTYPIPANDDSLRCVSVIAGVLGRAGQEGQLRRHEATRRGHMTFNPTLGLTVPVDWDEQQEQRARHPSITALLQQGTGSLPSFQSGAPAPETTEAAAEDLTTEEIDRVLTQIMSSLNEEELEALENGTITRKALDAAAEAGRLKPNEVQAIATILAAQPPAETDPSEVGEQQQESLAERLTGSELEALQQGTITQAQLDKASAQGRLTDVEYKMMSDSLAQDGSSQALSDGAQLSSQDGLSNNNEILQAIVERMSEELNEEEFAELDNGTLRRSRLEELVDDGVLAEDERDLMLNVMANNRGEGTTSASATVEAGGQDDYSTRLDEFRDGNDESVYRLDPDYETESGAGAMSDMQRGVNNVSGDGTLGVGQMGRDEPDRAAVPDDIPDKRGEKRTDNEDFEESSSRGRS